VEPNQVAIVTGASRGIERPIAEVLGVAPGPVDTEMFGSGQSEKRITQTAAAAPVGRLGTVDPMALVAVLAFSASGRANGQAISTSGGIA
jgi:hypothetical protein